MCVFDRIKDMLNRGGYKIFSVEVEHVLSHHPGVLESAIVGKPCPVLGERVHAFVSRRDPALGADDLTAFCAARLADYKVPESFTLLDEPLPRNANGKAAQAHVARTTAEHLMPRLDAPFVRRATLDVQLRTQEETPMPESW